MKPDLARGSELARRVKRAVVDRVRSQLPLVDHLRSTATSRNLRRRIERLRVERLIRTRGSVEGALDRIVADALESDKTEPDQ